MAMAFLALLALTLQLLAWRPLVVAGCPQECACAPYRGMDAYIAVDCSARGLKTIPDNLPENTKSLNFANNNLLHFTPLPFSHTSIEEVNLENNFIQTFDAIEINNFHLRELNLRGNRIRIIASRSFNMQGNVAFEDFVFLHLRDVVSGRWHIRDLTELTWPCTIDLRKNPITLVEEYAFTGSSNFTVLIGESHETLRIMTHAFGATKNILGVHITDVSHLSLSHGAFDGINKLGWLVIDRTAVSLTRPLFSLTSEARPHWLRISNSVILELTAEAFVGSMAADTSCSVETFPYGPNNVLHISKSTIQAGGIEIVNNTLPTLPANLIKNTRFSGIYFQGNQISGLVPGVFSSGTAGSKICIIRLENNGFAAIPSGAFSGIQKLVNLIISGNSLTTIEENAFKDSREIGSIYLQLSENAPTGDGVVRSKAFSGLTKVKLFALILGESSMQTPGANGSASLSIEAHAFSGMGNVDYMSLVLNEHMPIIPEDFFTGLQVSQQLFVKSKNLSRIQVNAFGSTAQNKTSAAAIGRLVVRGAHIPCDCETAKMYGNMRQFVTEIVGLRCMAPFDDGTMSFAWNLDHATCASCKLPHSLVPIIGAFMLSSFWMR